MTHIFIIAHPYFSVKIIYFQMNLFLIDDIIQQILPFAVIIIIYTTLIVLYFISSSEICYSPSHKRRSNCISFVNGNGSLNDVSLLQERACYVLDEEVKKKRKKWQEEIQEKENHIQVLTVFINARMMYYWSSYLALHCSFSGQMTHFNILLIVSRCFPMMHALIIVGPIWTMLHKLLPA